MSDQFASFKRIWNGVFFASEPALNLAAARVLFSVHALWILLSRDLPAMSSLPSEFWMQVPRADLLRYFIFVDQAPLEYCLQFFAVVALVGAAAGIAPRVCCLVAALLLYHLAPLETIFWTASPYQRGFTIDVLALFTLSLSQCGDALRIGKRPPATASPAYCWPLRLIQLYLAQTYFISGYAKLFRVGWSWMEPENLRSWFLIFAQQDQVHRIGTAFTTLGPWIAEHWLLCLIAGWYGVLINLCFISTVVSRRARWILVPDALFFHIVVFLSLNIFWLNFPQLLVFMNWQWLAHRLRRTAVVA